MRSSYSGQLGELLLDGGSWHLYRNGIASRAKSILWQNVEEIYLSGSRSSVEFVPAGENMTIKIIDSHKNNIKITFSGFFRMSESRKYDFATVYNFILQNAGEHQWIRFLKHLEDGERISFGLLDISSDGIYYKKIFGRERIVENSITGYDIRKGEFYLQHLKDNRKLMDRNIGNVESIPNIHILQTFIKGISEQNSKERG